MQNDGGLQSPQIFQGFDMTSFWFRFLVPLDRDLLAILGGGEPFSTAELAAHLHVTERAIQHAKKRLLERHLLRIVDAGGGRGRPAKYMRR